MPAPLPIPLPANLAEALGPQSPVPPTQRPPGPAPLALPDGVPADVMAALAAMSSGGPAPAAPAPLGAPPDLLAAAGALPQFIAETQEDGTVVLYLRRPDGSRGPAVKIVRVGGRAGAATT